MALSEDLDRLDVAIRQLQVKWDLFFSGAEKKPPTELQGQVDALVKQYANAEIRNSGERFRYQSLTSRLTSLTELWQKRLRAREEGKVFGLHGLRAEQVPTPPPSPPPSPRQVELPTQPPSFRVGDGERDTAAIRALYDRFAAELPPSRAAAGRPPARRAARAARTPCLPPAPAAASATAR